MDNFIASLPVQSVWIGVGLLAALGLVAALAGRAGVSRLQALSVFSAAVCVGGVMSRVFWILMSPQINLSWVREHFAEIVDPRLGGHNSFGAMAGGALVLCIWWWVSRREALSRGHRQGSTAGLSMLDLCVLGGLLGLGFARMGCLADGCDFGRVSEIGWAVRHARPSQAFSTHFGAGLVSWDAHWSLPVHPFGLYLAAGSACIVFIGAMSLWRSWLAPGKTAFFAGSAYLIWRFGVEFTRDNSGELSLGIYGWPGGLNIHQYFMIAALIACVICFFVIYGRRST